MNRNSSRPKSYTLSGRTEFKLSGERIIVVVRV